MAEVTRSAVSVMEDKEGMYLTLQHVEYGGMSKDEPTFTDRRLGIPQEFADIVAEAKESKRRIWVHFEDGGFTGPPVADAVEID